ncbi:MAG: hypothetical protein ACKOCX_03735 [Planctomycetota bacterium]
MGIVAFCPEGHRVKVKEELAGRKGICPHCGARFRIPEATDSPSAPLSTLPAAAVPAAVPDVMKPGASAVSTSGLPIARFVSLDAELAATLPRALPLASPPAAGSGG